MIAPPKTNQTGLTLKRITVKKRKASVIYPGDRNPRLKHLH